MSYFIAGLLKTIFRWYSRRNAFLYWFFFLSVQKFSSLLVLRLAFQSLGVVYGDLGTSPLYVFYNTFPRGIDDPEDILGALSLIIYSLTLVPLLKYVFVVLRANDNGQGELWWMNFVSSGVVPFSEIEMKFWAPWTFKWSSLSQDVGTLVANACHPFFFWTKWCQIIYTGYHVSYRNMHEYSHLCIFF